MKAVSDTLYKLILELQSINSLSDFHLAGGTSLALRFNHRVSYDIDLFTNKLIGIEGFNKVKNDLEIKFEHSLLKCIIVNEELGDQYCFLRSLILKDGRAMKVELLQNMQFLMPVESFEGARILSVTDIGLFKLKSAYNRKANKDFYDLDFLTDIEPLHNLIERLKEKENLYSEEKYKCIFDLEANGSLSDNISELLDFDEINYESEPGKPSHSNDLIDIIEGHKKLLVAKRSFKRKVKNYLKQSSK